MVSATVAIPPSTRQWAVRTDGVASGTCQDGSGVSDFGSGSSFTLDCFEGTNGSAPPPAATTLTVSLVVDNTGFGTPAPSAMRTITPSGNSCTEAPESITIACTSNGAAGGTPIHGIVRLHIRAVAGGVGAYDRHSEDGAGGTQFHGIFRCNPDMSAAAESNPQSTYNALDTIGSSFTADSNNLDATNTGNAWVTCGPVSYNLGNNFPMSTAKSNTATIVGDLGLWQDDCTNIRFGFVFTRFSAVTGFTTTRWATWIGTPPTGVSFTDGATNASLLTTATLDRTITPTNCLTHLDSPHSSTTIALRVEESLEFHCDWTTSRGTVVPSNRPARGFVRRSGTSIGDTTDYASVDFLFGAGGSSTYTAASESTAPHTNDTPTLDYGIEVRTYSTTARTSAELASIGNKTNTHDISRFYGTNGILNEKNGVLGQNQTQLVLGEGSQFVTLLRVMDPRGSPVAGVAIECIRTRPGGAAESGVSHGTTSAAGDSARVEYQVGAPTGQWNVACTGARNGNTVAYAAPYLVVSSLTSNLDVAIFDKIHDVNGQWHLNVSTRGSIFDPTTDRMVRAFPDDENIRLYAIAQNRTDGVLVNLTVHTLMSVLIAENGTYFANVSIPRGDYTSANVYVKMNLSGKTFLVGRSIDAFYIAPQTFIGEFIGNLSAPLIARTMNTTADHLLRMARADLDAPTVGRVRDERGWTWTEEGALTASAAGFRDNLAAIEYAAGSAYTTECRLAGTTTALSLTGWVRDVPLQLDNQRLFNTSANNVLVTITSQAGTVRTLNVNIAGQSRSPFTMDTGGEYFLTVTYDNGTFRAYRNASLQFTDATFPASFAISGTRCTFGGQADAPSGNRFLGDMMQWRVYAGKALNDSEISYLFENSWAFNVTEGRIVGNFSGATNVSSALFYGGNFTGWNFTAISNFIGDGSLLTLGVTDAGVTEGQEALPYYLILLIAIAFLLVAVQFGHWFYALIGAVVALSGFFLLLSSGEAASSAAFLKPILGIVSLSNLVGLFLVGRDA